MLPDYCWSGFVGVDVVKSSFVVGHLPTLLFNNGFI